MIDFETYLFHEVWEGKGDTDDCDQLDDMYCDWFND